MLCRNVRQELCGFCRNWGVEAGSAGYLMERVRRGIDCCESIVVGKDLFHSIEGSCQFGSAERAERCSGLWICRVVCLPRRLWCTSSLVMDWMAYVHGLHLNLVCCVIKI